MPLKIKAGRLSAALVAACRLGGAFATFLVGLVVARAYGADGVGAFFFGQSFSAIAAILSRGGLDKAFTKLAAELVEEELATGEPRRADVVWGLIVAVTVLGTALGLICAMMIWAGLLGRGIVLQNPSYQAWFYCFCMSVPAIGLLNTASALLFGAHRALSATIFSGLIVPASTCIAISFLVDRSDGILSNPAAVAALVNILAAAAATWMVAKSFPRRGGRLWKLVRIRDAARNVLRFAYGSRTFTAIVIANGLQQWLPNLVVGELLGASVTGALGLAVRMMTVVQVIVAAVGSVYGPRFVQAFLRDKTQMQPISAEASAAFATMGFPVIILIWICAPVIGNFFSKDLQNVQLIAGILMVSQLVNVLTGPAPLLLVMCGYDKLVQNVWIGSATLLLALLLPLTLLWGAAGTAIAVALVICGQNLMAAVYARRRLGVDATTLYLLSTRIRRTKKI